MAFRSWTLLVAVAVLALGNPAQANLVTNPGFETSDFTGWTQSGNTGFTGVDGSPHSGSSAAFFGPVGSLGFISQNLGTTPGAGYDLRFFLRTDGGTPSEFQVLWNGAVVLDKTNLPATGYSETDLLNLLATGALTPLSFGFRDDPGFMFFDNVSVTPTPEPATVVLCGTAMAAAGLGGWRRLIRGK